MGLIINVKIVVNSEAQQNKAHHFGIYYHPERAKPSDLSPQLAKSMISSFQDKDSEVHQMGSEGMTDV